MTETNSVKKNEMNMEKNFTQPYSQQMDESFFARQSVISHELNSTFNIQHSTFNEPSSLDSLYPQPLNQLSMNTTATQLITQNSELLTHKNFFMNKFLRRSGLLAFVLMIVSLFLAGNVFGQTTMVRFPLASDLNPDIVNVIGTPTATQSGLTISSNNLCSGTSGHYYCQGSGDYVDITLNTTGYSGISISWQQKDFNSGGKWNLSGDADNNGAYEYTKTNNATVTNSCATITVSLPASFDNKGTVHLRLTSANVSGNNTEYLDNITFSGTVQSGYCAGNAISVTSSNSVSNPNDATGAPDGDEATFNSNGDQLVLDLTGGNLLNNGGSINVTWRRSGSGNNPNPQVRVELSADNSTWATQVSGSPFTVSSSSSTTQSITLNAATRYIRFTIANNPGRNFYLDAVSYFTQCSPPCTNPVIGTNPSNSSICAGNNTSFTVSATGSNLTYQWQVNTGSGWNNISNSGVYSGATTSTLNIAGATTGMDTYQYQCVVSSGSCNSTSTAAILTISSPTITTTGTINSVCFDAANSQYATLVYSAATHNPVNYSIDWDVAANTAGLADQALTSYTFLAGGGSVTDILIPANVPAGTYYGVMTLYDGPCTGSQNVTITVNAYPTASFNYEKSPSNYFYCQNLPSNPNYNITTNPLPNFTGTAGGTFSASSAGLVFISATTGQVDLEHSAPGVYTVTYTVTENGCSSNNATAPITILALPSATISYSGSPFCHSDAGTKSVSLTQDNDVQYGSYTANPNGLSINSVTGEITPSSSTPGTYTITYTFASASCSNTTTTTVTILASPSITSQPLTPAAVCDGNGTATISVVAAGDGLTYQWQVNTGSGWNNISDGGFYSNTTTSTLTITNATLSMNGYQYHCVVSGTCPLPVTSDAVALTVNSTNTVGAASSSPTLCINSVLTDITHATTGATGIGAATGLPAGVTASWSSNTITISGTPTESGTFNYSIPLSGGCGALNATGTITVTAAPVISMNTDYICLGSVSTILSPTSGGTWVSNNPVVATVANDGTVTAEAAGTVTFTFTDGVTGCSNTTSALTVDGTCQVVTLTQPAAALEATIETNSPTTICEGGSVIIKVTVSGGTTPYSVTIGSSTQTGIEPVFYFTVSPNTTTTYNSSTVTVTDANIICTSNTTGSVTVTVNPATHISSGPTGYPICIGNAATDLSVTATGTGTLHYQWFSNTININSGGTEVGSDQSTFTPDVSTVGNHYYYVVVTGDCGTVTSAVANVVVNPLPTVTCPASFAVCINAPLFALTGGAPLGGTYSGDGVNSGTGVFTPSVAGVGAHTITYSYTDANGCTNSCTFTITVNALPVVTCPTDFAVCVNAAVINLYGESPVIGTYSGDGVNSGTGVFTPSVAGVGAHTITYSYTDANGCTNSCTFTITVNALPVVTCPTDFAVCVNDASFALTGGSPSGGTYSGAGVSAGNFDPLVAGAGAHTITYTYTDLNGCTNSCTFTITVNATPNNISGGFSGNTICAGQTGQLTFDANNSTFVAPYTIEYTDGTTTWSQVIPSAGDETFNVAVNPSTTTTYTLVSITNGNGCKITTGFTDGTAQITVRQLPVVSLNLQTNVSCNGGSNGEINIDVTGGNSPYTYLWSNGATTEDITGLTAGTYTVVVTSTYGCASAAFPVTITEPAVLTA
ncbi:MAG: HYR domain-containing protein, partial [Bacteroidetes bacterium]|nr:HYR domain-containing protein [Bacteroidota bacterium]